MVDYIKNYPYIIFQGLNGKYEYGYNLKTKEWKGIHGTIKNLPFKKIFNKDELLWNFEDFIITFSKFFDIYYPYKNVIMGLRTFEIEELEPFFQSKDMYTFLEENKNKEYQDKCDFKGDFIEFIAKKNGFIIPHWIFKKIETFYVDDLFNFIEKYKNNIKVKNLFNKIFSSTGYFYNGYTNTILLQINEYITLCKILKVPMETGDFFRNYDNILKIKESRKKEVEETFFKNSQEEKKLFFEDKNYITVIPMTYKEVQKEGEILHNCLGQDEWNNYLSQGKRKVVFIRKKENPDESYIACDINNYGDIQQFLKKNNNSISIEKDGEDIFKFKNNYENYLSSIWNMED